MLLIILLLVTGAVLSYISQDNLSLVSVTIGPYVFANIPLFYVIIASLGTGFALSYVIHLYEALSNLWVLRGKKNEIEKNKSEVLELTKRIHQLELENEKLKPRAKAEPVDRDAL